MITEAALSPDGKTLAVIARGEVFVRSTEEGRPTRRVTDTPGASGTSPWSPDGKTLYFSSDDTGRYAIYAATVSPRGPDAQEGERTSQAAKKPKTEPKPKEDRARRGPGGSRRRASPTRRQARRQKARREEARTPRLRQALVRVAPLHRRGGHRQPPPTSAARSPSPDGKKLLYTHGLRRPDPPRPGDETEKHRPHRLERARGPVDARLAPHRPCPRGPRLQQRHLAPRTPTPTADGPATRPVNLTRHPDNDVSPRCRADGKVLDFLSERAAGATNWTSTPSTSTRNSTASAHTSSTSTSRRPPRPRRSASPSAPSRRDAPDKSPKTSRRAEAKDDEPPSPPRRRSPTNEGRAPKAGPEPDGEEKPEPLKFDVDDAYLRVRRITSLPGNEGDLAITPAATASSSPPTIDGERAPVLPWTTRARTASPSTPAALRRRASRSPATRSPSSRPAQAFADPARGGKVEPCPIDAPVMIDVAKQQRQKFLEAARAPRRPLLPPDPQGPRLGRASPQRYLSLAERTRTSDEFNRVVNMLFGELDGSPPRHLRRSRLHRRRRPPSATSARTCKPVPGGYQVDPRHRRPRRPRSLPSSKSAT